MDGLTEYEKERAENIRKNDELLAMLDVQGVHDEMGIPAPPPKGKGKAPPKTGGSRSMKSRAAPRPKRERVEEEGLRRSTRRRTGPADPDETPEEKERREAEEVARAEEERVDREVQAKEREEELRIQKEARRHAMKLIDLDPNGSTLDTPALRSVLSSLCNDVHSLSIGNSKTSRDEEIKTDRKLEELQKAAKKCRIQSSAKLGSERIYCMAYHPEPTKDVIFFGDKTGAISVWDALAAPREVVDDDGEVEVIQDGQGWRLQFHWPATSSSSVSALKFDPIDAHSLISSSYDCTLRLTSLSSDVSRQIFTLDDVLIHSFDLPPHGNEVWISDASGCLSHLDMREKATIARRWDVNGTGVKIGSVSVNPVSPHFLLTGSNDRTLKLWDARKLQSLPITSSLSSSPRRVKKEEGNPEPSIGETDYDEVQKYLESKKGAGLLRATAPHPKSVSSAYWDSSGRRIVSTCYDNNVRVWDLNPSSFVLDARLNSFDPITKRGHNTQTGKWVTILRAQWMPSPNVYPHFVIGNMDNKALTIVGYKGEPIADLRDPHRITAVQAVAGCHPSRIGRYASANASGKVVLWAANS